MDSITKNGVSFEFILHPPKNGKQALLRLLRFEQFTYPVCIDDSDAINKLNHFPKEMMFQTFLLDRNNKVLAMGNPIYNPKVAQLYMNIVTGKEAMADTKEASTTATLKASYHDFGSFPHSSPQHTTFTLLNAGHGPLVIQGTATSCGCTTVEYPKEPVQPGDSLQLKVTYRADHPERFNQSVTVYCNAEGSPFRLKISGEAK
ncbi:MAG: DUF1573 domain-containing protein [Mediterranea sp.]|jgi:hypothetical protein|nr:DUF1573 domain-containing protein [Mediterranea sp.]